jgi:hypothetical protein
VTLWRIHQVANVENLNPRRLESVDGLHQADVALLDQIEQRQPSAEIAFGDRHNEAQVRFDELMLRLEQRALFLEHTGIPLVECATRKSDPRFQRRELPGMFRAWRHPLNLLELPIDAAQLRHDLVHDRWANREVPNGGSHFVV